MGLQWQRVLQWQENVMYQMAIAEFSVDEADLWLRWRRSQIDKIGNLDKMQCLRVDSRVNAMYNAKYPNAQQHQSWNSGNQRTSQQQQQQQQVLSPPPPPPPSQPAMMKKEKSNDDGFAP